MNKVAMFAVYNDTAKWAVLVDGYYGLFDTEAAAKACHAQAAAQFEFYHGSLAILPPNQTSKTNIFGQPFAAISASQAIDIAGYVKKRPVRADKKHDTKSIRFNSNNLPVRFVAYKAPKDDDLSFFDFDTVEDVWRRTVHGVDYSSYYYDLDDAA